MNNEEWIKETIPLRDSILYKRVYRNEQVINKHIFKIIQGSGIIFVFKFKNHFPFFYEVNTFLSLLEEAIGEIKAEKLNSKQIKSYLVRILYGDWIIEVTVSIPMGIVSGIIANAIWEWIKSKKENMVEEIEEFEEYYPDSKVIRWRRRRKYR